RGLILLAARAEGDAGDWLFGLSHLGSGDEGRQQQEITGEIMEKSVHGGMLSRRGGQRQLPQVIWPPAPIGERDDPLSPRAHGWAHPASSGWKRSLCTKDGGIWNGSPLPWECRFVAV